MPAAASLQAGSELVIKVEEVGLVSVCYRPATGAANGEVSFASNWAANSWFEMTFWLVPASSPDSAASYEWYPVEQNFPIIGKRSLANVLYDDGRLSGISRASLEQRVAANFASSLWACQLKREGWLELGVRVSSPD